MQDLNKNTIAIFMLHSSYIIIIGTTKNTGYGRQKYSINMNNTRYVRVSWWALVW